MAKLCALFACLAAAIATAEPLRCSIIADDFEPRAARITRIDDAGLQFIDNTTNAAGTLPLSRLVRLESFPGPEAKDKAATLANASFVIVLRDGQRWTGTPGAMAGDDLEWQAADVFGKTESAAGAGRVPLKSIVAVASLKNATPADLERASSASGSTQDELRLTNGDVLSGVVSASDAKTVTCAAVDGQPVTVDWANVRVAKFATVSGSAVPGRRAAFRLTLRDGRVIDGDRCAADGDQLEFFTSRGGRLSLVGDAGIVAIEHSGGGVQMLADLPPAEQSQSPYFPTPSSSPAKLLEVKPTTVILAGRAFRSSILARPRSSIRWALDGTSKTFATRYAIPAGRPLADVTVRVKLDDKVVHERAHVKAGAPVDLLTLPLGAARSITLEVDYGDAYDVQDDFYWLEPALLNR